MLRLSRPATLCRALGMGGKAMEYLLLLLSMYCLNLSIRASYFQIFCLEVSKWGVGVAMGGLLYFF